MAALRNLYRRLPGDAFDRLFLVACVCALAIVLLGYRWIAPEVPIHFDRSLRPDRFVGKPLGPFVLPAVATLLYGIALPLVAGLRALGLGLLAGVVKSVHLALALLLLVLNLLGAFRLFGP